MNHKWSYVNGDNLHFIDKAVNFLQHEFSTIDVDQVWSIEYFKWKLSAANPAGSGYISLAMLDDKVVGIVSLTKKRLLINGVQIIGGEVGDSYTTALLRKFSQPLEPSSLDRDPSSYINRSIFGRLASETRLRAESDGIKLIYGTPNSNAYPGWTKRLGYLDVQGFSNYSYSRPTWRFIIKKYPNITFTTSLIKAIDNSFISIHALLCRLINSSLRFDLNLPDNDEIEELWMRIKPKMGFSLVRDWAYWQHRYLEHPLAKYIFFSIRRNDKLVGLVVIRKMLVEGRKNVLLIVEWMTERDVSFNFILTNILDVCKEWEIDVFSLYAKVSGQEAKASLQSFFLKRQRIPVIMANTSEGLEISNIKDHIYFYLGSTDAA